MSITLPKMGKKKVREIGLSKLRWLYDQALGTCLWAFVWQVLWLMKDIASPQIKIINFSIPWKCFTLVFVFNSAIVQVINFAQKVPNQAAFVLSCLVGCHGFLNHAFRFQQTTTFWIYVFLYRVILKDLLRYFIGQYNNSYLELT